MEGFPRDRILRWTIFLAAVFILSPASGPLPRPFAQLPDFLKPKNLPLEDVGSQTPPGGRGEGEGTRPRCIERFGPAPRISVATPVQ